MADAVQMLLKQVLVAFETIRGQWEAGLDFQMGQMEIGRQMLLKKGSPSTSKPGNLRLEAGS